MSAGFQENRLPFIIAVLFSVPLLLSGLSGALCAGLGIIGYLFGNFLEQKYKIAIWTGTKIIPEKKEGEKA
jgi:hypothetical protein